MSLKGMITRDWAKVVFCHHWFGVNDVLIVIQRTGHSQEEAEKAESFDHA